MRMNDNLAGALSLDASVYGGLYTKTFSRMISEIAFCLHLGVRPPQLAASFISKQACDVAYWHKADIPSCTAHVRF